MPRIPVAFDVLGTCYGLDAAKDAIIRMFGKEHLAQMGVKPELLVEDWFRLSFLLFSTTQS